MAEELLHSLKNRVKELTLVPSGGGVFNLTADDNLLFSKDAQERFPDQGEALSLVKQAVASR